MDKPTTSLRAMAASGMLSGSDEERELKRLGRVTRNDGRAMPRGARIAAGIDKSRGQAKRATRKAVADLVDASQRTLVVNHIQPRWLRAKVAKALGMGARITALDIDMCRALGPDGDPEFFFPARVVIARG